MTWQEELRKLDENLASGNLSADEYRTRRDQILSSAVTSTDQQDNSGEQGSADSTQVIAPLTGTQPSAPQQTPQQAPQASPQQPAPQPSPQHGAEATQMVPPHDLGAERTQAVQAWQVQQHHQTYPASPAGGFAQPGQPQQQPASPASGFVQPGQPQQPPASPASGFAQPGQPQQPPASPAGGFAQPVTSPPGGFAQPQGQPQGQPWNAPEGDSTPPWGGGDFPPLAPQSDSEWGISQGPESSFDEPSSGRKRTILFSAIAFVVLAGIGVAVWLLFVKDDGSSEASPPSQSQEQPPPPSPTSTPLPQPPAPKAEPKDNDAALVDPPGKERNGGGNFDLKQLEKNKLLPESVISALDEAGMSEGMLKSTSDDGNTIGVYALEVSSEDAAATVANEYAVNQQESGLPTIREMSLQGVQVLGAGNPNGDSVYRAVYVVYNRVVIIDVYGEDQEKVEATFTDLLDEQIHHAPPTVTEG